MMIDSQKNNFIYGVPDSPIPMASFLQWGEMALVLLIAGDGVSSPSENIKQLLYDEKLPDNYVFPKTPYITIQKAQELSMNAATSTFMQAPAVLSIPNNLKGDEKKDRVRKLDSIKKNLDTAAKYIRIKNRPHEMWYYGQGVKENKWYQNIAEKGMENIKTRSLIANNAANAALQKLFFGIYPPPVNTFTEIANIYEKLASVVPVPNALKDWNTDASFGQDRLTYGGYSLKAETVNFLSLDQTLVQSITGTNFQSLLDERRVFKVDYSFIGAYSKTRVGQKNPFGQYVPSVYAQFYLTPNNNFLPLAIKIIENDSVYTPKSPEKNWMLAKLAFGCAEGNFLLLERFVVNHMIFEGLQSELLRTYI
jgi:hypothetical protein